MLKPIPIVTDRQIANRCIEYSVYKHWQDLITVLALSEYIMPTFFVIFFLLFTCKVPHPLHQLCGPFLHIPIPITIHHLICSLAPIMGLHSSNEVLEAHEPWPPQVEHHIGNDPLCLLRQSAKVGEDGIAVLKSNADILCEELLYSFISHYGPYRLPILWVTAQNAVANAYSWFLL